MMTTESVQMHDTHTTQDGQGERPSTQTPIFGPWRHRMDEICDGDEAARLLSLRAAAQGAYRLYTRESVNRAASNGMITPVWVEGLKNYYLKSDVAEMHIQPWRARDSATVEQLQERLARLQAMPQTRKVAWQLKRTEGMLALAQEVSQMVDAYWLTHVKPKKRASRRKKDIEERLAKGQPPQAGGIRASIHPSRPDVDLPPKVSHV